MEIIDDLKRVIWHEFGHLCVEILETEVNTKFTHDSIIFSYYQNSKSEYNWSAKITMIPNIKWEEMIKTDLHKTCFSIISLFSGCVFEIVFLETILKTNKSFNDCFCIECSGDRDKLSFSMATNKLIKTYNCADEVKKFLKDELIQRFQEIVQKNNIFIQKFSFLVNDYAERIYNEVNASIEYSYTIKENELKNLINQVCEIMIETSLKSGIIELKEILKNKILES